MQQLGLMLRTVRKSVRRLDQLLRVEEDNMEEAMLSHKHRVDLELLHGT